MKHGCSPAARPSRGHSGTARLPSQSTRGIQSMCSVTADNPSCKAVPGLVDFVKARLVQFLSELEEAWVSVLDVHRHEKIE